MVIRVRRRGCADMSDGLTAFVAVVLVVCLFAFCYGYWHGTDEQVQRRKAIDEYQRAYHPKTQVLK